MRIAFRPFLFILLISCSMSKQQKKYIATGEELKEKDCYTDRKNLNTLIKTEGEIFQIDNVNFGIRCNKENETSLLPCNLPQQLQEVGVKIVFSGIVKETRMEELWAGQPFVLTEVEEK